MATECIDPCEMASVQSGFVAAARSAQITPSRYFRWKPTLARLIAVILLIPGVPLIGLLMVLVRLTSRGPALFRQTRVGLHGRVYTMYKIRTMIQDAEATTGPTWSPYRDARITALGRVLRKVHLDELPQLINVLQGDMALIGPRPERPEIVHRLADLVPGYFKRLAVPPGITGLAQVNLPPDSTLDDVRRKLVLDLEYIRTASFYLDARLFACTLLRLLQLPNRPTICLLGLHRDSAAKVRAEAARRLEGRHAEGAVSGNGNGSSGKGHPPDRKTVAQTDGEDDQAVRNTMDDTSLHETIAFSAIDARTLEMDKVARDEQAEADKTQSGRL